MTTPARIDPLIGVSPLTAPAPAPVRRPPNAAASRGPLLAVCGLTGGAGTTTIAYLVACAAAAAHGAPVLVSDAGGPSGGLAALANVEVLHSLPELADQLSTGQEPSGALYAASRHGVRVLATGPEFGSGLAPAGLTRVLSDAREAHRLTVLDCGTFSRDVERTCAAAATHIAWVLPATAHGVRSGARVLAAAPSTVGVELLVARAAADGTKASPAELRRLATHRHVSLVLVPSLPGLDDGRLDRALDAAEVPLQAILGVLDR